MEKIPFTEPGTYLFRFLDHRTGHFWSAIADMLSEQKLFMNSRANFNDPYDSRPIVQNNLSTSAIRKYFREAFQNPFNPKRTSASTSRLLDMKASGQTRLKKDAINRIKTDMRQATEDFLDKAGLLSFSLTAKNPLLWGHYAASFAGICVVFQRGKSTNSALSICANVSYVDRRPRLPMSLFHEMSMTCMSGGSFDALANQIFYLSFLHKSHHWAYEREARIFYPFSSFEKLSFEPDELIGVILGPKSQPDLKEKIRSEISVRRPSLRLYTSTLSQNDFEIIIPRKFMRSS